MQVGQRILGWSISHGRPKTLGSCLFFEAKAEKWASKWLMQELALGWISDHLGRLGAFKLRKSSIASSGFQEPTPWAPPPHLDNPAHEEGRRGLLEWFRSGEGKAGQGFVSASCRSNLGWLMRRRLCSDGRSIDGEAEGIPVVWGEWVPGEGKRHLGMWGERRGNGLEVPLRAPSSLKQQKKKTLIIQCTVLLKK